MKHEETVRRAELIKISLKNGTMKLVKRICGVTGEQIVDADDEDIQVVDKGLNALLEMVAHSDSDMAEPQTIPEIIAGYRQRAKEILGNGVYEDILEKEEAEDAALDLEIEADRIEAAYKRELGNAQKMREALTRVKKMAASYINCHDDEVDRVMTEIVATCDFALAACRDECAMCNKEDT